MPLGKGYGAHLQRKEDFRLRKNIETVNSVRSALFAKFMKKPEAYPALSISKGPKLIQVPRYLVSGRFGDVPVDHSSVSLIRRLANPSFRLSFTKTRVEFPVHITILNSRIIEYLTHLTILLSTEVEILFESFKFQLWCRLNPPTPHDSLQICSMRQVFTWNLPLLSRILSCFGVFTINNYRCFPVICTDCQIDEPFHTTGSCYGCCSQVTNSGKYESCEFHGSLCRYVSLDECEDNTLLAPRWSYLPVLADRYSQLIHRLMLEDKVTNIDLNICTGSCALMFGDGGIPSLLDEDSTDGFRCEFPDGLIHVARFLSTSNPACKRLRQKDLYIVDEWRCAGRRDVDAFQSLMYFTGT